jgi:hypothetical protein
MKTSMRFYTLLDTNSPNNDNKTTNVQELLLYAYIAWHDGSLQ